MKFAKSHNKILVVYIRFIKILLLYASLISYAQSCPLSNPDKKDGGQCIEVNGHQMYINSFGKKSPSVIFDAGAGDNSKIWIHVTKPIAEIAHVVVYDRVGFGKSQTSPGNNYITSQNSVDDLRNLLHKANITPPYILVGHSLGGLNMQLFAQEYPKEVAAVVLIDSVSRNQTFLSPHPPKKSDYYYREYMGIPQSRDQVRHAPSFPNVPLIVLTAIKHRGAVANTEPLWWQWQRELTKLSSKGMQMIAWPSDHYIQNYQPELVVDAVITAMVEANFDIFREISKLDYSPIIK